MLNHQLMESYPSEILPQFREYERTSTVAVNAYVQPLMARYLNTLQERLSGPSRIMQSSGGSISATAAAQQPIRTVLSGPAGGVIGAFHVAQRAGHDQIITLDMGGTSTDVALCPGVIPATTEAVVAGCPVAVPTVGIHSVGAGGGSLVRLDVGNALIVGPDSAGAVPGPVCYGTGENLTVTDANVVLGRIDPAHFLGGRFPLYPERAQGRLAELAERMGVSVQEAALGIIRVVNANMERALRTVSLEQGYDPRQFTLLPFGGAGPLHACELAEALRIPRVFIPRYPGVLSALGMILAPIVKDYVQTVMLHAHTLDTDTLEATFAPLEERARSEMQSEIQSIASGGVLNEDVLTLFYRNVRTPWERRGDMDAQIAASRIGESRLQEILARYDSHTVQAHADALFAYSAHLTRAALALLPEQEAHFTDYLDDDGWGMHSLPITVHLYASHGVLTVDFRGSALQSAGCVNAVKAVTHSAVLYVVRCLVGEHVPVNQGCLEPVTIIVPCGSLLNPVAPAAVAAGNVETSRRVVDALFGALAQLAPQRIPAASQGTMNNLTFGGYDPERDRTFAYYETMGGGMGARPGADGLSGVHIHMTNTRNTPVEALEMEFPLRIRHYALRHDSGGAGRYRGGDGLYRSYHFLAPATVTLLTDRRRFAPYGLHGGEPGATGSNTLERNGTVTQLPSKVTLDVQADDTLTICTPGGGGFLPKEDS